MVWPSAKLTRMTAQGFDVELREFREGLSARGRDCKGVSRARVRKREVVRRVSVS